MIEIEKQWEVPVSCQKLVAGAQQLMCYDTVEFISGTLVGSTDTLLLTLVTTQQPIDASKQLTFKRLVEGLESPHKSRRDSALELICRNMEENNAREAETIIALLMTHLSSQSPTTRVVAVGALARISPRGNKVGLQAAVRFLKDSCELVRMSAAEAIGRMAPVGHKDTIDTLRSLLRHQDPVKVSALTALSALVRNYEDRPLLGELTKLTDHSDESVRAAAYEAAGAMQ